MSHAVPPPLPAPPERVLALEGVCLARGGHVVLDDASVAVHKGELLLVEGARGAGKSSLLAVAAGALRPDHGDVWIAGRSLLALQRGSLPLVRRTVGHLPAEPPLLLDETALENVMIAPAARGVGVERAEAQALELLVHFGLGDRLGWRVSTLSGGARRLVALARALCGTPPIALLDDPTLGLDGRDREAVAAALVGARAEGAALLVTTTDEPFAALLAERGARRARLDGGRVVAVPNLALVDGGTGANADLRARAGLTAWPRP